MSNPNAFDGGGEAVERITAVDLDVAADPGPQLSPKDVRARAAHDPLPLRHAFAGACSGPVIRARSEAEQVEAEEAVGTFDAEDVHDLLQLAAEMLAALGILQHDQLQGLLKLGHHPKLRRVGPDAGKQPVGEM